MQFKIVASWELTSQQWVKPNYVCVCLLVYVKLSAWWYSAVWFFTSHFFSQANEQLLLLEYHSRKSFGKKAWTLQLNNMFIPPCLVIIICSHEHQKSQAVQRLDKEYLLAYLEVSFYLSLLLIIAERGKRKCSRWEYYFFGIKDVSVHWSLWWEWIKN